MTAGGMAAPLRRFFSNDPRWRPFWLVAAVLLVAFLLLAPALWNGYPLIYFDSEDYVEMSFTWHPILWRIMTYSVFCTVARLFDTLWAVVALQALMVAWTLREAVFAFVGRWRNRVFVALGLALAALTGLAIVTSELMADVFGGTGILGIATLAFGQGLTWPRRLVLAVIVLVSVAVHMAHVAVACGLMLVLAVMLLLSRWVGRMPRPRMVLPLLATALGTLAVPATNWVATGDFYFEKAGHVLQLALFVQNGLAKKYLDVVCPQGASLKMCAYKDELPFTADEFLWGDSPFEALGGWTAMHDEADAIIVGAARMFPLDVAEAMANDTWTQLNLIADAEDLVPMTWHFVKTQLRRYPHDFRHFRFARQQRELGLNFDGVNRVHVPLAEAAEVAMLGFLIAAWRRRDSAATGLMAVVAMALLGNAFVCGALSNPHDRYQNCVVWLALFASVIGAIRLDQRMLKPRADSRDRLRVVSQPAAAEQAEREAAL